MAQVQEQPGVGSGADTPTKKMGRKKIQISRIADERNRQVTFTKRKFGLMKKAYELSVLCDCEIALIIFNSANKLFQYASTDMDKVLLKYTEYNEPHESRTNKDIIDALNKKEHKGCDSPDPECDPYMNSMSLEEKYNRMNDDYQRVLQQNQMRSPMSPYPHSGGLSPNMPMHNSPYMNHTLQSPMGQHSPSISSPGLLQPPVGNQNLSPRPNSTGNMVDMSHSPTPNGYHRASPCSSPGVMVNKGMGRQSPSIHGRAPPGHPGPPRLMVPDGRNNMINSEMAHSPGVPAVSISTPSISQGTGYHSPIPSYHNNEYSMSSGDSLGAGGAIQQGYSPQPSPHHWSQGSLTSGIPPGGGGGNMQQMQGSVGMVNTGPGANHVSPLLINTMNHRLNIKSEPASPTRDSHTPTNHLSLRPPSQGQGHLSPVQGHLSPGHISPHLSKSPTNCPSPSAGMQQAPPPSQQQQQQQQQPSPQTGMPQQMNCGGGGGGMGDYDGPMMKRPRMEGWTT